MKTMEQMLQFVEENMPVLRIVVQTQWDFVNYNDIQKWFNLNVKNDIEGKYYLLKILLNVQYYKKKDIIMLLKHGLFELIYGKFLKERLILEDNIYRMKTEHLAEIEILKSCSVFCPILDSIKPCESGNTIISDLVHSLDIKASKVDYHWKITPEMLAGNEFLIFVDDCLGSGKQVKKFFQSAEIRTLITEAKSKELKIYCLVLVGYNNNVEKLQSILKDNGITLCVPEILTDRHRIFHEGNEIWSKSDKELENVLQYFRSIAISKGIGFVGFNKLDFAVILNNRTPNWTIPLIWKKGANWDFLLQRKSSFL